MPLKPNIHSAVGVHLLELSKFALSMHHFEVHINTGFGHVSRCLSLTLCQPDKR